MTRFQNHCYSENLEPPGIEPRTSVSAASNSDHKYLEKIMLLRRNKDAGPNQDMETANRSFEIVSQFKYL
jgi:hypothetical protein